MPSLVLFHTHNYCLTCRESGKGDDPCITNQSPCNICASFSEEQQIKIKHRRWYVRKQKASDPCNTIKEDDLGLLGDDVEAFSGSQADLEGAADNLFSSPPRPQPLCFESLSLKTPQTVKHPTPATNGGLPSEMQSIKNSIRDARTPQPREIFSTP